LVHSISYGGIETEEEPTSAKRFSTAAQQLGAQGVTIMVASGDDGVANYLARSDPSKCGFNPSYPATVPFVVAVGATQGPEYGNPEIMCSSSTSGLITSGGGFSTIFSTPSYQTSVVASYLRNGPNMPPTSMFNSAGRGYPDVAVMGHNFEEVIGGSTYEVSGTSAASPTFAGMVTLVNGLRLSKGKSALGFLNPALYSIASSVYNDITSGTNNCCAGNPGSQTCCTYGFTASSGWDPTTGLGSIDYPLWAAALVAL
jgi:tripeptidyl-peptidase-1